MRNRAMSVGRKGESMRDLCSTCMYNFATCNGDPTFGLDKFGCYDYSKVVECSNYEKTEVFLAKLEEK